MIIEMMIQVNSKLISIQVPRAVMLVEIPHVVALRSTTGRICAIGKTEDEMRQEKPATWERIKFSGGFEFIAPFDSAKFNPTIAEAVIRYYSFGAHMKIRPILLQLFRFVDRFDYKFQIAGYESISAKLKVEFKRLLNRYHKRKRLSINGESTIREC
jgi:hypothetical protein